MKVVLTEESLNLLEETLEFYINGLSYSIENIISLKNKLLQKAESLSMVEGTLKLFTG